MNIIDKIEQEQLKKNVEDFNVGDTVRVHTKIKELDAEGKPRERIQIFTGVVIGRRGRSVSETFTVRRISYGEGVERIFPLHSPAIDKIEIERHGQARRAKLYYLRGRIGKEAMKVREPGIAGKSKAKKEGQSGKKTQAKIEAKTEAKVEVKGEKKTAEAVA